MAFSSNRAGRTDLYEKPATGAGVERAVYTTKNSPKRGYDWTRDGRFLIYVEIISGRRDGADIFALPLEGGKPLPVIQADFNQNKPQLSRDNRWLAYVSDESGREEVYIQPFSLDGKPAAQRWQISANGGTDPRWRRDGREFFYLATDGKLMSFAIGPSAQKAGAAVFAFDSPQPLFTLPPMNSPAGATSVSIRYAVAAEGKRFLYCRSRADYCADELAVGIEEELALGIVSGWSGRFSHSFRNAGRTGVIRPKRQNSFH